MNDVVSWLRRLVGSQSGQGLREAPGLSVPGHGRFAPSPWIVGLECSGSDEDEVSLALKVSRADFPEVSFPRNGTWRRTVLLFREENMTIPEAHSISYAVRYAESCNLLGLLILSDVLGLVLALYKGRSKHFILLSVLCRRFCLIFHVDAIRIE